MRAWIFQVVRVVKNRPVSARHVRDEGLIPGLGWSPGGRNGNPHQYFCLGNPMDRGAWRTKVHGLAKSQTWLSHQAHAMHKVDKMTSLSVFFLTHPKVKLACCILHINTNLTATQTVREGYWWHRFSYVEINCFSIPWLTCLVLCS